MLSKNTPDVAAKRSLNAFFDCPVDSGAIANALQKFSGNCSQSLVFIRYALEINDPWLAELVPRADAGEILFETVDFSQTPHTSQHLSNDEKVEALVEMIWRAGDEPQTKSAALLVLMATIETSMHPKALANTAKHLAFTRCGELNLLRKVEEQVARVELELFAGAV
jgi:hypothetical protein